MSGRLLIVSVGGLATTQDLGRPGWRRLGVPRSGALVPALLRIANALVGQADNAPAIEFFLAGPTLKALDGVVQLAVVGDVALTLQPADGGAPQRVPSWRSVTLKPGDTLRVGAPQGQRVGYVAAAGLDVPLTMGSASTYLRAKLGGPRGEALTSGDMLELAGPAPTDREPGDHVLPTPPASVAPTDTPIRAVPGPQADHFDDATLAQFFATAYTVTPEADRMGVRLQGPPLVHRANKGAEITSDATVPGSIQVPGNGQPIVLLADGQTAGGYPKIATVISADLPRLAVAPVGSTLRFARVSVQEGEAAAREHEAALLRLLATIRPLARAGEIDLGTLYAGNLISGMIDATLPPDGA